MVGATLNVSGRLVVRATKVGSDTALAQVARLVAQAQAGKAQVQRLADRVSGVFVPVVIGLSMLRWPGGCVFGEPRLRRLPSRGRRRRRHRLPVRARPGHADRSHGRHRARRPARDRDQGPRGPGTDPEVSRPSSSTRPAR